MEPRDENLIPIFNTQDSVQESLVTGALEEAGIHYVVMPFDDTVFTGVQEQDHGHSRILVLEHERNEAEEIISEYRSQNQTPPDMNPTI